MAFFGKTKTEQQIEQIQLALETSFNNVKNDTTLIFDWLNYFYKKTQEQHSLISSLKQDINNIPKSPADIKSIIERYYSFDSLIQKINELNQKIETFVPNNILTNELNQIQTKISLLDKTYSERHLALDSTTAKTITELHNRVDSIFQLKNLPNEIHKLRTELIHLSESNIHSHAGISDKFHKQIEGLNEKINKLAELKNLALELNYLKHHIETISKKTLDYDEKFSSILSLKKLPAEIEYLKEMIERSSHIKKSKTQIFPDIGEKLSTINQRLEKIEAKKQSFKEKIAKKIAKKSKEYIKSIIISYIKKYSDIPALQLKEMIVDEQNLCSKSSFYRLLTEIEQEDDISVIQKGKEKHYLSKMSEFSKHPKLSGKQN